MSTFGAVVVCCLSAIGLGTVIWAVASVFVLPMGSSEEVKLYMLVSTGDGMRLQPMLRALKWLKDMDILGFDALVLDRGMDPVERKTAEAIARAYDARVIFPEELNETIN